jgi:hypothetical protein
MLGPQCSASRLCRYRRCWSLRRRNNQELRAALAAAKSLCISRHRTGLALVSRSCRPYHCFGRRRQKARSRRPIRQLRPRLRPVPGFPSWTNHRTRALLLLQPPHNRMQPAALARTWGPSVPRRGAGREPFRRRARRRNLAQSDLRLAYLGRNVSPARPPLAQARAFLRLLPRSGPPSICTTSSHNSGLFMSAPNSGGCRCPAAASHR